MVVDAFTEREACLIALHADFGPQHLDSFLILSRITALTSDVRGADSLNKVQQIFFFVASDP